MARVVTWCPLLVLLLLLLKHPAASSPQRSGGDNSPVPPLPPLAPPAPPVLPLPALSLLPPAGSARRLTCPKSCEDSFRPVCGSNNKVYRNLCHLHSASCLDTSITKINDGPCVRTPDPPCKEVCTKIYTPVCASDGNSYNNVCIMELESCRRRQVTRNAERITIIHEGLCDTPLSPRPRQCGRKCPDSYEPVCGSNRQTYYNECELSVAKCLDDRVRQRYVGVCDVSSGSSSSSRSASLRPSLDQSTASTGPHASVVTACQKPCTGGFRPVCGNNGVTYNSECLFNKARCINPAIEKKADGVCLKDCSIVCPTFVDFVCGNNNVSYQNDCFLIIDHCKDSSIRKISEGRCTSTSVIRDVCNQNCTISYRPVCGSDGATYTNLCTLNAATCHQRGLVRLYNGECRR